ncbi:hypothetical protein [Kitasatospora terrestris]|uniref:DUF3846 domain-containing protein n=1 Tax=Kitasatospora terrestris TaxID=258051 RepID=A0ABP9D852_9ACTN
MTGRSDTPGSAGAEPEAMVWALVVHASADEDEPLYAEAIIEFDTARYPVVVTDALDSGLALAVGEPPPTTAAVHVDGHLLTRIDLVGGRQVWEPDSPLELSEQWLSAAEADGGIVLTVVPPGTWPQGLAGLVPEALDGMLETVLEDAQERGPVLHGAVRLVEAGSEAFETEA